MEKEIGERNTREDRRRTEERRGERRSGSSACGRLCARALGLGTRKEPALRLSLNAMLKPTMAVAAGTLVTTAPGCWDPMGCYQSNGEKAGRPGLLGEVGSFLLRH